MKEDYCPRCGAWLECREDHQFCVPCNFWWSWTGSSWMGKPGDSIAERVAEDK